MTPTQQSSVYTHRIVIMSFSVWIYVKDYPFKPHKHYSLDYVRQFPHLRPRTLFFGALLRVRNAATMAIHKYFQVSTVYT